MTSRDFCYWLQGFFEINSARLTEGERVMATLSPAQTNSIRKHLALVFEHEIDPSMGPENHQAALNAIHSAPDEPAFKKDAPPSHPNWPGVKLRC